MDKYVDCDFSQTCVILYAMIICMLLGRFLQPLIYVQAIKLGQSKPQTRVDVSMGLP